MLIQGSIAATIRRSTGRPRRYRHRRERAIRSSRHSPRRRSRRPLRAHPCPRFRRRCPRLRRRCHPRRRGRLHQDCRQRLCHQFRLRHRRQHQRRPHPICPRLHHRRSRRSRHSRRGRRGRRGQSNAPRIDPRESSSASLPATVLPSLAALRSRAVCSRSTRAGGALSSPSPAGSTIRVKRPMPAAAPPSLRAVFPCF